MGFACYLLGIQNSLQLSRDPLRGNLFENAMYLELKKHQMNKGMDSNLFYFRDSQKHEVDFIFKKANQLIPIEVKSSKTYHSEFIENLKYFQSLAKDRASNGYLIYAGELEQKHQGIDILNYQNATRSLND